jgi:hypothetical protein
MRRTLFTSLGVLEFLTALVLLTFAWQLPGPAEVHDTVGRVERVSRRAAEQVDRLRNQVRVVRERQPQLKLLSERLRTQLGLVNDNLRNQQVDYRTVRIISDSFGDVAGGLEGLSVTLDPRGVREVGSGLKATADYLDAKVAPGAEAAAVRLEKTTAAMKADAERLGKLLKEAPLDLRAARAASASLREFDAGLGRMLRGLKAENYAAIRDGFQGLEESLKGGAAQVDRLAGISYPTVKVEGLSVEVEQHPLWPEGKATAAGMRRAAKGVKAAGRELKVLHRELPQLRTSLEGSRRVVRATRVALDTALAQQRKLEPLLQSVPTQAARMAEELPRLGGELAALLRETAKLKEVAALLRQAQHGVEGAAARWPQLRANLAKSSVLLRVTQRQLRTALARRNEYESAAKQTLLLTDAFTGALPFLTEQVEEHLAQQERSLVELEDSIHEVSAVLPECSRTASRLLVTTRLLLSLVALVVALHAGYLLLGIYLGARYSVAEAAWGAERAEPRG